MTPQGRTDPPAFLRVLTETDPSSLQTLDFYIALEGESLSYPLSEGAPLAVPTIPVLRSVMSNYPEALGRLNLAELKEINTLILIAPDAENIRVPIPDTAYQPIGSGQLLSIVLSETKPTDLFHALIFWGDQVSFVPYPEMLAHITQFLTPAPVQVDPPTANQPYAPGMPAPDMQSYLGDYSDVTLPPEKIADIERVMAVHNLSGKYSLAIVDQHDGEGPCLVVQVDSIDLTDPEDDTVMWTKMEDLQRSLYELDPTYWLGTNLESPIRGIDWDL